MKPYAESLLVSEELAQRLFPNEAERSRFAPPYRNGADVAQGPRGVHVLDFFGLAEAEVRERAPEAYQYLWLRPEFQNPQGAKASAQEQIPGTEIESKKAAKIAVGGKGAKVEKRAWPKELPQQVAAMRELLAEAGVLDLANAKAAFKGAREEALAAALDSLAALGLAVASGAGGARSWSAVR